MDPPSLIFLYSLCQSQELRIFTDAGRICRPLYVVSDLELLFKSEHALQLETKV